MNIWKKYEENKPEPYDIVRVAFYKNEGDTVFTTRVAQFVLPDSFITIRENPSIIKNEVIMWIKLA